MAHINPAAIIYFLQHIGVGGGLRRYDARPDLQAVAMFDSGGGSLEEFIAAAMVRLARRVRPLPGISLTGPYNTLTRICFGYTLRNGATHTNGVPAAAAHDFQNRSQTHTFAKWASGMSQTAPSPMMAKWSNSFAEDIYNKVAQSGDGSPSLADLVVHLSVIA